MTTTTTTTTDTATLTRVVRALRAAGYDRARVRDLLRRAKFTDLQRCAARAVAELLRAGISPDDAAALCGGVVVQCGYHAGVLPGGCVSVSVHVDEHLVETVDVPVATGADVRAVTRDAAEAWADCPALDLHGDRTVRLSVIVVADVVPVDVREACRISVQRTTTWHGAPPEGCGSDHAAHDWVEVEGWRHEQTKHARLVCAICSTICHEYRYTSWVMREYTPGPPDARDTRAVWDSRYLDHPQRRAPEWLREVAEEAVVDSIGTGEPMQRIEWGIDVLEVGRRAEEIGVLVRGATARSLALAGDYQAALEAVQDEDDLDDLLDDLPREVADGLRRHLT